MFFNLNNVFICKVCRYLYFHKNRTIWYNQYLNDIFFFFFGARIVCMDIIIFVVDLKIGHIHWTQIWYTNDKMVGIPIIAWNIYLFILVHTFHSRKTLFVISVTLKRMLNLNWISCTCVCFIITKNILCTPSIALNQKK